MNAGERKAGYPNSRGLADLPAGYGLSLGQLESLRKAQVRGVVPMLPAIGDSENEYEVPEHEFLHVYHVEVQSPIFNQASGEREDRGATIQLYNVPAFKFMEKNGGFRGKEVKILHNPEIAQEFVAEQQEQEEQEEANNLGAFAPENQGTVSGNEPQGAGNQDMTPENSGAMAKPGGEPKPGADEPEPGKDTLTPNRNL